MADVPRYPGIPRWVKVLAAIIASALVLAVVIVLALGHTPPPHGP